MNEIAKQLIDNINSKLKAKPLIFFSRDIERSVGLESVLHNFYQASIEASYISDQLENKFSNTFSLNSKGVYLETSSTLELVKNSETHSWINNIVHNKEFYAQLFQFNQPAIETIEKLGGRVLNNNAKLNRQFESKLSQFQILQDAGISLPKGKIGNISEMKYEDLSKEIGPKLVIQLDRAHTGAGTFFINNSSDWDSISSQMAGNIVKVNELIEGQTYTINGCVTTKGIYVAGLQYQITGYPELTQGAGSTVGNDFSYGFSSLDEYLRLKIVDEIKKIGEEMKKENYKGLFGVDFIVRNNEIFIIEINARQTANIPFQTKLELIQDKVPLSLINLAEWLDVEIPIEPFTALEELHGAQVFLRSKNDKFEIKDTIKSGVYRLQSDNSAKLEPSENVLYLDEEQDKPLIWQEDGYAIDQVGEGGFVLLVSQKGLKKDKFDEVARMQFKNQIISNGKLAPWILEAMIEIEHRIQ